MMMKHKSEKIVKQVNRTEYNKTEEDLKQSEEKYRKLVENVQDGVFIIQDAKMSFVNEAFARMIGYTVDEIIGMNFKKLVAPEDLELVANRYYRRQAGEDVPSEYEFCMLHKDGNTRVFVNMNVGLINYRGKIASIGTVKNITKRKQMEKEQRKLYKKLEEANKQLRELTIIDPHTGLYNFRYLEGAVEREFEYAKINSHPVSLTMMGIDYFKSINNVYGHKFGDLVLKQLVKQLKGKVRRYDTVIRLDEEEFIIILPGVNRVKAVNMCNKILNSVNSYCFGNKKHSVRLR
jgi:diguanylate cyclase (GGDEF)-like protein/PAS domain S-box-containing protein